MGDECYAGVSLGTPDGNASVDVVGRFGDDCSSVAKSFYKLSYPSTGLLYADGSLAGCLAMSAMTRLSMTLAHPLFIYRRPVFVMGTNRVEGMIVKRGVVVLGGRKLLRRGITIISGCLLVV